MAVWAYLYYKLGNNTWGRGHGNPFPPFLTIILFSLVIGTAISIIVGRKILAPITDFSKAAKEIAKGNFDIYLDESHPVNEISEVAHHFNLMVQELRSIETLRNDFVVNVSHEFKTPIAAIEGYAMLLQEENLSRAEHDEYTGMIIESSRQLSNLSGNILKISKLENQEMLTEQTEYMLDEQLRQALLLLEPFWGPKQIGLNIDLEELSYYGNEELMMQVWLNVLGNAVKFTPEGGEISVSLSRETDGWISAVISDTGTGMAPAVRKHIFEKFYQGDPARSAEGNGLGLPLAARIISLSKGTIEVRSEPGQGSSFTIKLPVAGGE
ncbi:HAMP domain-containing sensor histidine kinase [Paenibacillus sp. MMS20-IR301]|uniref:HAMP domain-containing sensor histidine kinase n=1 Tax=Paenibacillus sp. MMS20-IR301 TaxID=2895946 RepID=UPI0028E7AB8F|nr:HAMP domain-containing sensor histidine kinase [Paenibacillus sp. MMS20-IR301]WNS40709.1 HAMP domain-containing sensor histidine kinase [Paenibacillus sp. MMS20-IR301]